ncbi:1,4-alpha-glucan branching enzyme [Novimethylophilus kurashikiensis]|uniref:1,4-alpha-glucan branching enzyme n=1 Tax=Novimethylophilus kurashikiensis TaxID=1825523 RepID=A0A2R5F7W2_9PROT|nr:hypothetical protein [Novimethylophilus kurashikiensis]GBG14330.1 1,4-alpha-glucan branching enzyme [Novimethylophilus kurashikiensis]
MTTKIYTLIALKEESQSYCRGCLMDTYSGDYQLWYGLDRDALIAKMAEFKLKNTDLGHSESGYSLTVLINGIPWDYSDYHILNQPVDVDAVYDAQSAYSEEFSEIARLAKEAVVVLQAQQAEKKAEADRLAKEAEDERNRLAAIAKEEAERAEYLRMQAKFGARN